MGILNDLMDALWRCDEISRRHVIFHQRFPLPHPHDDRGQKRLFFPEDLPGGDDFLAIHAPDQKLAIIAELFSHLIIGHGTRREPDAAPLKACGTLLRRHHGFEVGLLAIRAMTARDGRAGDAELLQRRRSGF